MKKKMSDEAATVLDTNKRLVSKKRERVPTFEDPREELKHLVKQHKALTRSSTAIGNMASDRTNRETGDAIPCLLPADVQVEFKTLVDDVLSKKKAELERQMEKQLKQIPIYQVFLKNVFGVGPVVAAYLAAEVDIRRAIKPSNLRRFCGMAVIDGRLERHAKGGASHFSQEMRTRLFQMFSAMAKNAAEARRADGTIMRQAKTSKYLDVWNGAKHRKLSMAVDGKLEVRGKLCSAKGVAHSHGWHKAADVFLEDLYVVWRALEGLEVWPSYYAAKLGYEHGGKISVNAPKKLTVEEALALVGDVGGRPVEEYTVEAGA